MHGLSCEGKAFGCTTVYSTNVVNGADSGGGIFGAAKGAAGQVEVAVKVKVSLIELMLTVSGLIVR